MTLQRALAVADDPPLPKSEPSADDPRLRWRDAALAKVTDAVIATDAAYRVIYLNTAAESMTGWQCSEAMHQPLSQVFVLLHEQSGLVTGLAALDQMNGRAALTQMTLMNRAGLEVGIECESFSLQDDAHCFVGVVLVARGYHHAAEIALQSSNESLLANADALFEEKERAQVTLNSIGDAVISTDFSGRVMYLNVVAESITGWVQAEASGCAVDEIFSLTDAVTRRQISCPTGRAIIENRRVSLEAECVLVRRDNKEIAVEVSAAPIHDREGGVVGAVMVAHDVTAARELSSKLERMALHDNLTDLPNRALFSDRLGQAMQSARIHAKYAALLYVDLDRFKHINDSLGHAIGDKLLQTVARRLLGCVRSSDTVSRQGGDEFVVLLADLVRVKDAVLCAEKILSALDAPYRIGEHDLRLTASLGVAIFPDDAAEGDALLRCADFAMYQAKYHGRNNYKLFAATGRLEPQE